jgi:hypothetical protein
MYLFEFDIKRLLTAMFFYLQSHNQPEVFKDAYTCPHCGVLSKQEWNARSFRFSDHGLTSNSQIRTALCQHCNKYSVWIERKMYFPENGNAPFPNTEMPGSVKDIYLEAASISNKSPRGAAALLRLSIQILCKELGEPGKNINTDIGALVKKGLPVLVQKSLDIVRVTGNDAVHPGTIDTDDINVVNELFKLVNIIVEYMIALPKEVSGIYSTLPANKLEEITKRDT